MAKSKIEKGSIFERYEKKFVLSGEQYRSVLNYLNSFMQIDQYGLHKINTIYYDTEDYSVIRHSLDKPKFKEKLRLRSYGQTTKDSIVFLELKKKFNSVTHKRRMDFSLREGETYLKSNFIDRPGQIAKELNWYMHENAVSPKVLIAYDRIALYSSDNEDFRVTFDSNLRWRNYALQLDKGDYGQLLLPPDTYLMETKTLGALPLEFSHKLSQLEIYPTSFSKYGTIYEEYLQFKEEYRHVG